MKAVIWTQYGSPDVLQLKEIAKPIPEDHEVLIHIHATTVTAGDNELRAAKLSHPFAFAIRMYVGPLKPTRINILGQELAGEIEAVGPAVTRFRPGRVSSWALMPNIPACLKMAC